MEKEQAYLRTKFSAIEDKRHQGYVEHLLSDVLIIIMSAVLCGLDGLAGIMQHAVNRAEFFKEKFGIEQLPSKPTVSRILNMIDGDAVAKVIIEIMKERTEIIGNIIAVDGKAIRSTAKAGAPHSALQILTAYLTEDSVVIGQRAIHNKTNEIPVFQAMLDILNIKGKTITADAMHCQKATCKRVIDGGGDYVFGLKENQKSLYFDVKLFIEDAVNTEHLDTFQTVEKGHGRIETRICYKVKDIGWLSEKDQWSGINSVFAIKRTVVKNGKTSSETNFYIAL